MVSKGKVTISNCCQIYWVLLSSSTKWVLKNSLPNQEGNDFFRDFFKLKILEKQCAKCTKMQDECGRVGIFHGFIPFLVRPRTFSVSHSIILKVLSLAKIMESVHLEDVYIEGFYLTVNKLVT